MDPANNLCYIFSIVTSDATQYPIHSPEHDEIDLSIFFKKIMSGWKICLLTSIIAVGLAGTYNHVAHPTYRAWTTFFLPSSSNSSLNGYAALLGTNVPANIQDQLLAIAESKRVQTIVCRNILKKYPNAIPPPDSLIDELDKKLIATKSKTGLFTLSYESQDREITKAVVEEYLRSLSLIYEEMELSADREIIRILDRPQLDKLPVRPNKSINLIISLCAGFGVGILFVLNKS